MMDQNVRGEIVLPLHILHWYLFYNISFLEMILHYQDKNHKHLYIEGHFLQTVKIIDLSFAKSCPEVFYILGTYEKYKHIFYILQDILYIM